MFLEVAHPSRATEQRLEGLVSRPRPLDECAHQQIEGVRARQAALPSPPPLPRPARSTTREGPSPAPRRRWLRVRPMARARRRPGRSLRCFGPRADGQRPKQSPARSPARSPEISPARSPASRRTHCSSWAIVSSVQTSNWKGSTPRTTRSLWSLQAARGRALSSRCRDGRQPAGALSSRCPDTLRERLLRSAGDIWGEMVCDIWQEWVGERNTKRISR